ncbi:MAG: ADP-dependent glucokinase/phosphofructokinase [Alphaproteobacteria bacterium]|nr:ADP-dependent glucokinase/phosphofructokinase [Alphaproteobacteria bacterium]
MINTVLKEKWNRFYDMVPQQLEKIKQVKRVATAFNTNIDAVVKISGDKIAKLAELCEVTEKNLQGVSQIICGRDAVRGIIKCFTQGIAEEWLCEGIETFKWLQDNIGYNRLQMGGQGGIVANAMAVLKVQNVYAHTASHPKLQAEQFLNLDNLLASDEQGNICKACEINRQNDVPLIHWIMEFDAGDEFTLDGKKFVCPKSNRFIATYDPANMMLKKDESFLQNLDKTGFDYMILSGYHNLTSANGGIERIKETVPLIGKWKADNPNAVIHLELASTQDIEVRKAIVEYIAPLADSVGLNEREALDVLEIIDKSEFEKIKEMKLDSPVLFEVLHKIKDKCRTSRIQLHFFGMYLTMQDKGFKIGKEQNKRGMMLAATIAAAKAGTGQINKYENLLWAQGKDVSDIGTNELEKLARYLNIQELSTSGVCDWNNLEIIAVPTILIEKPLTLVGMGDTISSISLVGAL